MSKYYQPLEAETVLYTLCEKLNNICPTKLHIKLIADPPLSAKRAAAIARYTVRIIVPEALDVIGLTDESQKLRNLPPNVDLKRARDAARDAAYNAYNAFNAAYDVAYDVAYDAAHSAAKAAANAAGSARAVIDRAAAAEYTAYATFNVRAASAAHATDAVHATNAAALYASNVTKKQRHVYHLNQMIQICLIP